jgi:hypothetical protein
VAYLSPSLFAPGTHHRLGTELRRVIARRIAARARRRRRTPPLAPPRRLCARSRCLCVVSKTAPPFPLSLVHNSTRTGSPEQRSRPLPAPGGVDARAPPLNPKMRAQASPLRVAPTRVRNGGR